MLQFVFGLRFKKLSFLALQDPLEKVPHPLFGHLRLSVKVLEGVAHPIFLPNPQPLGIFFPFDLMHEGMLVNFVHVGQLEAPLFVGEQFFPVPLALHFAELEHIGNVGEVLAGLDGRDGAKELPFLPGADPVPVHVDHADVRRVQLQGSEGLDFAHVPGNHDFLVLVLQADVLDYVVGQPPIQVPVGSPERELIVFSYQVQGVGLAALGDDVGVQGRLVVDEAQLHVVVVLDPQLHLDVLGDQLTLGQGCLVGGVHGEQQVSVIGSHPDQLPLEVLVVEGQLQLAQVDGGHPVVLQEQIEVDVDELLVVGVPQNVDVLLLDRRRVLLLQLLLHSLVLRVHSVDGQWFGAPPVLENLGQLADQLILEHRSVTRVYDQQHVLLLIQLVHVIEQGNLRQLPILSPAIHSVHLPLRLRRGCWLDFSLLWTGVASSLSLMDLHWLLLLELNPGRLHSLLRLRLV